jgi:hypothetical protein
MTRVQVNVGFREGVGFESIANHAVTRSFVAPSLKELRRKITVAVLMGRRTREELMVSFLLDSAAQAEWNRRQGAGV